LRSLLASLEKKQNVAVCGEKYHHGYFSSSRPQEGEFNNALKGF